ncbi:MAG: hypothetical protein Q7T24_03445, partial [Deltaproteobacteria bacterium]|nr:hypothetical protein [Deltaproteobacteria bacterium]
MHIKRFTGPTVRDAIKAVKAELGGDALIINTKRLATGLYEVIAAIDYDLTRPVDLSIPFATGGGAGPGPENSGGRTNGTEWLGGGRGLKSEDGKVDEVSAFEMELKELRSLKDFCW